MISGGSELNGTVNVATVNKATQNTMTRAKEAAALFWLHQAHHGVRAEILAGFKEAGCELTSEQWTVLNFLWQSRKATQTKIAEHTGREKPAVTRLLRTLEDKGFIKRVPIDRRTNQIELTREGEQLHDLLFPIFETILEKIMTNVSSEDLVVVGRVLRNITKTVRSKP